MNSPGRSPGRARRYHGGMARVLVVHWKPGEIGAEIARLSKAHEVTVESRPAGEWCRGLRDDPPDAVVIDLSRLPSHGREVGNFLRTQKATRGVPLIFVGGEEEKVARVRALLPDAHFCSWRTVRGTLTRALRAPARDPAVPGIFAGYSGTPLPKKLGVKEGSTLALLDAPDGFDGAMGPLPEGVRVVTAARGSADVAVLFVESLAGLRRRWPAAARMVGEKGRLWVAWPKKTSGVRTDLSEPAVREHGLGEGLVDFKVCAIDGTWSGLAFTTRKR